MKDVFLTLWNFCQYEFQYGNFTFSLWNVIEAGIVLSIIGFALGKIFFFIEGRR